uniref:Predicted protein n=1 Tax=Physcomitrium patens TaxID=3218 RepID=A9U4V3_PHYPA
MADAMAGCHVLRNVKSSSLLLLLQFQHVKGRRRESCKVRIVSGRFRSCLTIGRERRSALKSSEAVTLLLISQFSRWMRSFVVSSNYPDSTMELAESVLEDGFLVVRKDLLRRDLESAIKDLQDQVRSGEASSEEFFELGAVMLRKKYYVLANKYLEQAIKKWDGDEADLAQVYNALGFSYFRDNKLDEAINLFEKAVKLRPGYVIAWYNLGNVYEVKKDFKNALKAYEESLLFDPNNKIAQRRRDAIKERVDRFRNIPDKD